MEKTDYNNCHVERKNNLETKYRATKIWNELLQSLRTHMCCKKHRRNLRTYENCFTGSSATDVMYELLKANGHLSRGISRSQAVKLLNKFLERHLIEDVHGNWANECFKDTNKLYRFPPLEETCTKTPKRNICIRSIIMGSGEKKVAKKWAISSPLHSPPFVRRYSTNTPSPIAKCLLARSSSFRFEKTMSDAVVLKNFSKSTML